MHFLRNVLAQIPKGSAEKVAAAICTIFAQPDAEHVREQLDTIASMLGRQLPRSKPCCAMPLTTSPHSPISLCRIGKRSGAPIHVIGVFPNPAALLRLAGSVLVEAHDEWQVAAKRYLSESTLALLTQSREKPQQAVAPSAALAA